jgi:hypothetical protein
VPVAVPFQVPVKGSTGPVGAIAPEAGLAAIAFRIEEFDQRSAEIKATATRLRIPRCIEDLGALIASND